MMPSLPIDSVLPALFDSLATRTNAVLQAPPGAGKTTRVPLALLDRDWLASRKIIVLEPRRLAARTAANRMAATLGEEVGQTVGYRVRMDSRVSARTRIEVVTQGVFLRQLQSDAALDGVGAVLFDEIHERSLEGDLALALCIQSQALLRNDLRLLAMSATLDGEPLAALMGGAPLITSEGRTFPVETRWAEPPPGARIEDWTARVIRRTLAEEFGSILVFLPGGAEIRRVERLLTEGGLPRDVQVVPLHGDLSLEAQDAAIRPAQGGRKVVLSTSIAETSLTIEGIRIVIDAGLARLGEFDPRTGMGRLVTMRVSRAAAEQRRGRAGRLGPGICVRLWSEASDRALQPFAPPEILRADLASLALDLAEWGVRDPADLAWLDPPPEAPLQQARTLLVQLGALGPDGCITRHGRAMAELGLHPRLAHMVLAGRARGHGRLACRLAALLDERDFIRGPARDADLRRRLELLSKGLDGSPGIERGALHRIRDSAMQLERQLKDPADKVDIESTGAVLALAYPDRIAQRRAGQIGQFRLANGRGAVLDPADPLAAAEFLAVADLDGQGRDARIFLAAPIDRAELEAEFADQIKAEDVLAWDGREEAVLARRRRLLFGLILADEALTSPPQQMIVPVMIEGIRQMGLSTLPWSKELETWRQRVAFLRRFDAVRWPDVSDDVLLATLNEWLAPWLAGVTRRSHLLKIDLDAAVRGLVDWQRGQELDRLAPTHLQVPSGSRIPIDYSGEEPVLAVRLQEMFGLVETPRVVDGRVPVLLHLLSPAHRPVQVTRDLASFWTNGYRDVKKDLAGRYPKHYWPDDPLVAEPTARAKRRGS